MTATILFIDDTLDEEDILMIFDELEAQNSSLLISFSSRVFLKFLAYVICDGQIRMRT